MKNPLSPIWSQAAGKIAKPGLFVEFTVHQQFVLDHLLSHHPELYMGLPNVSHSKETILELSQQISHKVSAMGKRERFDFLSRGFEAGNTSPELNWDVPLGPVYVKINREKNYATPDRFRTTQRIEAFIENLAEHLKGPAPETPAERLGQILLFAILFSGLLDRKWIKPFLLSIKTRQFYQEGEIFWVEMQQKRVNAKNAHHDDEEEPPPLTRRLEPDHLTRLLIYRFVNASPTSGTKTNRADPWKVISTYLKSLSLSQDNQPGSLGELLEMAFSRYLLLLPGSLVGYARGDLPSTSMPIGPWLRNISINAIPVCKPAGKIDSRKASRAPKVLENQNVQKTIEMQLFSGLLRDLSPKSGNNSREKKITRKQARSILKALLDNHKHEVSTTFQLLVYWTRQLLDDRISYRERRKKSQLKPSSIHRYLTAIGEPIIKASEEINLLNLDPCDLEIIYENASARRRKSQYNIRRLCQFHGFLEVFYKAPRMEWSDIMATGGPTITNVRANLISPHVYNLALQTFGWEDQGLSRWQTLHIIAIILLFRCGFRPSELQSLRLVDIQGVIEYEILIRNSPLADVKTNSGIRRVIISGLLTDEELNFVLAYYNKRLKEDHYSGGGVFLTHPVHRSGMLSDKELFDPIRKVLREVTLDDTLLLYHLRHSFVSLTNAYLLTRDDLPHNILPDLNNSDTLERIKTLKQQLFKNEPGGRKGQYQLAMMTGHNSPETTHAHYNHLSDRLLGHYLKHPKNCIPINQQIISSITNTKRSRAYQFHETSKNIHALQRTVDAQAKKFAKQLRHPLLEQAKPMRAATIETAHALIPGWDEVIEQSSQNKTLHKLSQNRQEWELAAQLYESVRSMDGRKIKTSKRAVKFAYDNYSKRWGGITCTRSLDARLIIDFLHECRIPQEQILIIHHPLRNQTASERVLQKNYWQKKLKVPSSNCQVGESANIKEANRKGKITIKVASATFKGKRKRTPKMSQGIMFSVRVLNRLFDYH